MKNNDLCSYIACQRKRNGCSSLCETHCRDWDSATAFIVGWTTHPLFVGCARLNVGWSSIIDFYYECQKDEDENVNNQH